MKTYMECLKENENQHHQCATLSKAYLQCRMDSPTGLMAKEDLNELGYGKDQAVSPSHIENTDGMKQSGGFVAGKHIKERKGDSFWAIDNWFPAKR